MFKRFIVVAAVAMTVGLAGQIAPASAEELTATQIKTEIIGKPLNYNGAFSGKISYHRNGKLDYTAKGKKFSGQWRLKKNKLCTKLSSGIRNHTWNCFTFSRQGKGRYRTSLGYKVWR